MDILKKNEAEYIQNSAEDIRQATEDMFKRTILNKSFSDEERKYIDMARHLIPANHWLSNIDIPISPSFIKNHLTLFSNEPHERLFK
jgi:hypothetical protein